MHRLGDIRVTSEYGILVVNCTMETTTIRSLVLGDGFI